ncbi:type IX secretion system membrane protein PorP/SprF [Pedobacter frigidisoli]|uniref:Type IX secretion system membrane protein PorP/SprF n=1 Tax=Pedobacter frigidisoli TaxID=2530455 RepID=A0A4R0P9G3_9SPHI|nr:type IX secretion system membrane protein PorP/SprF [Pedobacter frigidisoli]TCD12717.1 type IX secretion system membrane protein PorP/SprF [Pedobacter frigidisoli]
MKFFFALSLCLSMSLFCIAQEVPRSTQYIFNNILLNPALSGIDNYTDLKLGLRKQWTGLEGSPNTQYLSLSTAIGEDFVRSNINSFAGSGDNPMSRSYVNNFTAAEPHHGIGLVAMTDKAGLVRQTSVNVTYAYHLGLTNEINLSLGLSGGFNSISVDVPGIVADESADPLFSADYNNKIRPDVGAGIWLYSPRFFGGISMKQILGFRDKTRNNQVVTQAYQLPNFYGTFGYKIFLDEDIAAIPSALISYWINSPATFDANIKLAYQDKFWVGSSFRNNDSFSLLAGLNIASLVNLSYSYDVNTSGLRSVNNGTHEIVLGILLNNRYQVRCPSRQF